MSEAEMNTDALNGALGAYSAIISLIEAGTPIEGLRHIAERNVKTLEDLLAAPVMEVEQVSESVYSDEDLNTFDGC